MRLAFFEQGLGLGEPFPQRRQQLALLAKGLL